MKKIILVATILYFATATNLFAQKAIKPSGFISTAGFSMEFFSNFDNLNSSIKEVYPEYKEFTPYIKTGFSLGFGYYFKDRFYLLTESYASSAPAVSVHENQYSELRSYGSKLEFSYIFCRYKKFDFEASVGFGGQYNSYLHTIKDNLGEFRPNLALSSLNTIVPIGITWWIHKGEEAHIGERAVGISLDYNIIIHKGITTVTGFTEKTYFPNIESNALSLSIVLKM